MAILKICDRNDPILSTKLERFDFDNPPTDPIQLAKDLTETMISHNGIGLAANQCGLPYRVFVIKSNPVFACFNPLIVDLGNEVNEYDEGCITFPKLFLKISRYSSIRVRFTMPNGLTETKKFAGLTARVFQHELDHVNGIKFTTHSKPLKLRNAIKKAAKAGQFYTFKELTA